jgi:hypothetical protein
MKVALLISGRIARYEACLIPFLKKNTHYTIDVFASINDDDGKYYDLVRSELSPWLKDIYIQRYKLPVDFHHTHDFNHAYLLIDGVYRPYTHMSMYFNDMNACNMAIQYSNKNNFNYDCIMKYRADIINEQMPDLTTMNPNVVYSNEPVCDITSYGLYPRKVMSATWDWGSPDVMKKYAETYNYVLETLKNLNGNYVIHFESNVTDNCCDKKMEIVYVNVPFRLDANRRLFDDKFGERNALRITNETVHNINTSEITEHLNIPTVAQI